MNINIFDLNLLKTFNALLIEGSTVKAAERIGLSQPAVSAALSRLRHVFGDPLFIRSGQGMEPTMVARELHGEVEQAIALIEGMLTHGASFDPADAKGSIWLSGSDHFSELLLPRLLDQLRITAPGLKIVLVDHVFENSLEALEKGNVDMAFWPEMPLPKWARAQHVMTTRFEFAARRGNQRLEAAGVRDGDTIPLDLTCDLPHVHFSPNGHTKDDMDDILTSMGRARRIIATVPTFAGVLSIVRNSDIIGTLPSHLLDSAERYGDITRHPLPVDRPDIPLTLLWHKRTDNAPLMKWLRAEIVQCFEPMRQHP